MPIKRKLNVPWRLYATSTFHMLEELTFPFQNADVVTTMLRVSVSIEYRELQREREGGVVFNAVQTTMVSFTARTNEEKEQT